MDRLHGKVLQLQQGFVFDVVLWFVDFFHRQLDAGHALSGRELQERPLVMDDFLLELGNNHVSVFIHLVSHIVRDDGELLGGKQMVIAETRLSNNDGVFRKDAGNKKVGLVVIQNPARVDLSLDVKSLEKGVRCEARHVMVVPNIVTTKLERLLVVDNNDSCGNGNVAMLV